MGGEGGGGGGGGGGNYIRVRLYKFPSRLSIKSS